MIETPTSSERSFSTENDQIEGYQRLSRLAIWSVPLGLLSAVSLVNPLLWFVPVIAIVFALGGLWQISKSDDMTGRRLALVGLATAFLFGSWGMSWTISYQMMINGQAQRHATEWLSLMQNEQYMQAHQLGMSYYERVAPGTVLEEHYRDRGTETVEPASEPETPEPGMPSMPTPPVMAQTPFAELRDFKQRGVPKYMADVKGDFEFAFVRNEALQRDGSSMTNVTQVFRLTFPDDHQPREMDITIKLTRTVDTKKAYWEVGPLSELKESG